MKFFWDGLKFPLQGAIDEELDFLFALGIDLLGLGLNLGGFFAVDISEKRDAAALWGAPVLGIQPWLEDGAQLVVILLRNGVVTMVMTLGAGNREAHERGGDDFQGVSHHLVARQRLVGRARTGAIGHHA